MFSLLSKIGIIALSCLIFSTGYAEGWYKYKIFVKNECKVKNFHIALSTSGNNENIIRSLQPASVGAGENLMTTVILDPDNAQDDTSHNAKLHIHTQDASDRSKTYSLLTLMVYVADKKVSGVSIVDQANHDQDTVLMRPKTPNKKSITIKLKNCGSK